MKVVKVTITGRVQRVGYRWWLRRRAIELGITGWVKNTEDGGVEALLCGEDKAVGTLLRECKEGPKFAKVEKVSQEKAQVDDGIEGFSILG